MKIQRAASVLLKRWREAIQGYILVDLDNDEQDVYLILEKKVQFKISVVKNAVANLMAVHYAFNLNYDQSAEPGLLFLQEDLLKLEERGKRKSATYLAASSALRS